MAAVRRPGAAPLSLPGHPEPRHQLPPPAERAPRWHDHVAAEAEARAARSSSAADLEAADLRAAIDRAVDELPERCRLIFLMSREQDLTYTQIADALGISVKTVETQMTRALRALRTRLAGYFGAAVAVVSAWRVGGV